MVVINVKLSDEKYKRLKELATIALTEFDTETRFKLRASQGWVDRGLELIEKGQKFFLG